MYINNKVFGLNNLPLVSTLEEGKTYYHDTPDGESSFLVLELLETTESTITAELYYDKDYYCKRIFYLYEGKLGIPIEGILVPVKYDPSRKDMGTENNLKKMEKALKQSLKKDIIDPESSARDIKQNLSMYQYYYRSLQYLRHLCNRLGI